MEVYTPSFNKIRALLEKKILRFIGFNIEVSSNDINEFVKDLKEENEFVDENFNLIEFTFSFPYSSQVQDLIVDLVRRCVIKQTEDGYILSSLGKKQVREYNEIF